MRCKIRLLVRSSLFKKLLCFFIVGFFLFTSFLVKLPTNVKAIEMTTGYWTDDFDNDHKIDEDESLSEMDKLEIAKVGLENVVRIKTCTAWAGDALDWKHMKKYIITNEGDYPLYNQILPIKVLYEPEMDPDFKDIRFRIPAQTYGWRPQYIENYNTSTHAIVWIEVPVIDDDNPAEIYMFYDYQGVSPGTTNDYGNIFDSWVAELDDDSPVSDTTENDYYYGSSTPDVSPGDGSFLTVWSEGWDSSTIQKQKIMGAVRNSNDGGETVTPNLIFSYDDLEPHASYKNTNPSVAYDGNGNWMVAWEKCPGSSQGGKQYDDDDKDISAISVKIDDETGDDLEMGERIPVREDTDIAQTNPVIEYNSNSGNEGFAIIWEDKRNINTDIYGSVYDIQGTPIVEETQIITGAGNQAEPHIAYDEGNNRYLLTWIDDRQNYDDGGVFRCFLDENLVPIADTDEQIISYAGSSNIYKNLNVEYCEETDKYLVTWNLYAGGYYNKIYGVMISGDGSETTFLGDYGVIIDDPYYKNNDIAQYLKSHFLVSYSKIAGTENGKTEGTLINSYDGTITKWDGINYNFNLNDYSNPKTAASSLGVIDNKIFVAWEESKDSNKQYPDVYAQLWRGYKYEGGLTIDYTVDPIGIITKANFTSVEIPNTYPTNVIDWTKFSCIIEKYSGGGGDISIDIVEPNEPYETIIEGIEDGDELVGVPSDYDSIRIEAHLIRTLPSYSPYIDKWKVEYNTSGSGGGCEDPTENLICHWKFDEGTGDEAGDTSPLGGNDGTLSYDDEFPDWVTGKTNEQNDWALEFGSDTYAKVIIPDTFDDTIVQDFTFAAWVYSYGSPEQGRSAIFDCLDSSGNSGFRLELNSNNQEGLLNFQIGNEVDEYSTTQVLQEDGWVHMAVVVDGDVNSQMSKLTMYFDGNPENFIHIYNYNFYSPIGSISPTIGNRHGPFFLPYSFYGKLDDVRIYNSALSEECIQYLASGSATTADLEVSYSDPRDHYKGGNYVTINATLQGKSGALLNINNAEIEIVDADETTLLGPTSMVPTYQEPLTGKFYFEYNWTVNESSGSNKVADGPVRMYITAESNGNPLKVDPPYDEEKEIDNKYPTIDGPPYYEIINGDTAMISVGFSEDCYSILHWGGESCENTQKPINPNKAKYAMFILSDLSEGETYYHRISAHDEAGNMVDSNRLSFLFDTGALDEEEQTLSADANGPYEGEINKEITFDGSDSIEANSSRFITTYIWDFDYDGITFDYDGFGETINHSYGNVGEYTVALKIVNNVGKSDTDITKAEIVENSTVEIDNLTGFQNITVPGTRDSVIIYIQIEPMTNIPNAGLTISDRGVNRPKNIIQEPSEDDLESNTDNKEFQNLSIYRYVDINLKSNNTYVYESYIKSAYIIFRVKQSWIETKNFDDEEIILLRHKDNIWEKLNTTYLGNDGEYNTYVSETKGFSTFAVVGSKVVDKEKTLDDRDDAPIPWLYIAGFIIAAMIALIFVLFKTKLIYIEKVDVEE